jgi:hypothetical protein
MPLSDDLCTGSSESLGSPPVQPSAASGGHVITKRSDKFRRSMRGSVTQGGGMLSGRRGGGSMPGAGPPPPASTADPPPSAPPRSIRQRDQVGLRTAPTSPAARHPPVCGSRYRWASARRVASNNESEQSGSSGMPPCTRRDYSRRSNGRNYQGALGRGDVVGAAGWRVDAGRWPAAPGLHRKSPPLPPPPREDERRHRARKAEGNQEPER